MKKHVFTIAAVLLAVGLSAFNSHRTTSQENEKKTSSYYFLITGDYALTESVNPEDAVFIGSNDPGGQGCSGSTRQCISIFDESQLDGEALDGPQEPQSTPYEKS